MNFGQALEALKAGQRVARAGWNGKGMWLALTPGSVIPADKARAGAAELVAAERNIQSIVIDPHIDMRTAGGSLQVGWLASQADMLGEDWAVLP